MEHIWEVVDVGNWFTEYECQLCKKRYLEEPEDAHGLPKGPCEGTQQSLDYEDSET